MPADGTTPIAAQTAEHPEVTRANRARIDLANAAVKRAFPNHLAEQAVEAGVRGWAEMGVDISAPGLEQTVRAGCRVANHAAPPFPANITVSAGADQ
jgi:hypothetical protein